MNKIVPVIDATRSISQAHDPELEQYGFTTESRSRSRLGFESGNDPHRELLICVTSMNLELETGKANYETKHQWQVDGCSRCTTWRSLGLGLA
jgi:hypothetical protein